MLLHIIPKMSEMGGYLLTIAEARPANDTLLGHFNPIFQRSIQPILDLPSRHFPRGFLTNIL